MEIEFLQFICPVKGTRLVADKFYPVKAIFLKIFKEILPLFILDFHMEIEFLFNLLYMELYTWYIAKNWEYLWSYSRDDIAFECFRNSNGTLWRILNFILPRHVYYCLNLFPALLFFYYCFIMHIIEKMFIYSFSSFNVKYLCNANLTII